MSSAGSPASLASSSFGFSCSSSASTVPLISGCASLGCCCGCGGIGEGVGDGISAPSRHFLVLALKSGSGTISTLIGVRAVLPAPLLLLALDLGQQAGAQQQLRGDERRVEQRDGAGARPQRALVLLDAGADALIGVEAAEQAGLAAGVAGLGLGRRRYGSGTGPVAAHARDPGSRRRARAVRRSRRPREGGRNVGRAYGVIRHKSAN